MQELILLGRPIPYRKNIMVYPPTVLDVISEPDFAVFNSILTTSYLDIWDAAVKAQGINTFNMEEIIKSSLTPYELFHYQCYSSKEYHNLAVKAITFFTREKVKIIPETKTIAFFTDDVKDFKDLVTVTTDFEFEDFQNYIRKSLGRSEVIRQPVFDYKKEAFDAKGRYRDRATQNSKDGISFFDMIVAICCMGIGINLLNIGDIAYNAVSIIFNKMQKKEAFETDLKVATAGMGNSKVKPVHWLKNDDN